MSPQTISIAEPSIKSLFIQMTVNGQLLSTGTAFVVQTAHGPMLITNRHNVTGRHQDTGQPLSPTLGVPDQIVIMHNRSTRLGEWVRRVEVLYGAQGQPLWIEHPTLGSRADFVALPLTQLNEVQLFPYDLNDPGPDISIAPAETVSVVGFPFGLQVGGSMAIWATGFVASEPQIDCNDLPVFLIDCRGRQGQSGSPVIAQRNGGAFGTSNGATTIMAGSVTRFLGIYSGRVNQESDLGYVWKTSAIRELVNSIQQ